MQFGFDQKYDFVYTIPYIDKKERLGLRLSGGAALNKEVPYQTIDNKLEFYRDDYHAVRVQGMASIGCRPRRGSRGVRAVFRVRPGW